MIYRIDAGGSASVAVSVDASGAVVADADASADLTLDAGETWLLPGLVNAHDHLHRNHYPRLGTPPYPDVYAWGEDLHRRFAREIEEARAFPRGDALLFGALKNLLGAATTVVHHDAWEPDFEAGFPVRVPRLRHLHTLRLDRDAAAAGKPAGTGPLLLHLAEGTSAEIAGEIDAAARLGLLDADLVAVHGVGLDEAGASALCAAGAALVWCPTSNAFLYGRGPDRAVLRSGVDVLLGTDALVSGDGTLLDELRAAAATGHLDGDALHAAVGSVAAHRLGLPEPSLAPGAAADPVVLRRPLREATGVDVILVVVDGRPRLGEERFLPLFQALDVPVEPLLVAGEMRWVESPLGDVARRAVAACPEAGRVLA